MLRKNIVIQLIILFMTGEISESDGLCLDNGANNGASLLLITFGSGPDQYSNATPASFNFSTTHQQTFQSSINNGMFGFVNTVPDYLSSWHTGASDHTAKDQGGYMFLVNLVSGREDQLFTSTVNGLCIGLRYEFSAFLANVVVDKLLTMAQPKPNVRFEVRASTVQNGLLTQSITVEISRYSSMTWKKYGLSFNTPSSSVTLLMFSYVPGVLGNSIAIDNVELRVCSNEHSGFCPPDETTTVQQTSSLTTTLQQTSTTTTAELTSLTTTTTTTKLTSLTTTTTTAELTSLTTTTTTTELTSLTTTTTATELTSLTTTTTTAELTSLTTTTTTAELTSLTTTTMNIIEIETSTNALSTFVSDIATTGALQEKEITSTVKFTDVISVMTSIATTLQTTTETRTSIKDPTSPFIPKPCNDSTYIGTSCNVPNTPCEMMKPCTNGHCNNNKTAIHGYVCSCPSGFNGTHCEFDHRLCKSHTCLNNGTCNKTSNATFHCTCEEGWQGAHCEFMTHDCEGVKCLNNGVCRPGLLNYACECLGDSYYGPHCEKTAMKVVIYKIVSKSFAYVAIVAMTIVAIFVVIMDILKYGFGIDLTREDLERYRREKQARKRKRPVIQRFVYVNAPSESSDKTIATIEEATV